MPNHPLPATDIASIERATLDAVSPAHTETWGDWLLAFDPSHIGRATSAVPLAHRGLPAQTVHTVQAIAARYSAQQRPAQFRVADEAGLADMQQALRDCGYAPTQATLTQISPLAHTLALLKDLPPLPTGWHIEVSEHANATWQSVYLADGFDPIDGAQRAQALSRAAHGLYAWICDDQGHALAAGGLSLSHGWASLHGMRTVIAAQNRGLAKHTIAALARAAQARGFTRLFLQVHAHNTGACALYAQLGFSTAWRYHYWQTVGHNAV